MASLWLATPSQILIFSNLILLNLVSKSVFSLLKVLIFLRNQCTKWKMHFISKMKLNPIQDGPFRGCSRMGSQKGPLSKICHIYPTLMKIDTVISSLNKIQKIHKSLDTLLEFCWHQCFFTEDQQLLVYQEIHV